MKPAAERIVSWKVGCVAACVSALAAYAVVSVAQVPRTAGAQVTQNAVGSRANGGRTVTPLQGGRALQVGGQVGGRASDAIVIVDAKGTPILATKLVRARSGHSATPLADGSVAIIGGVGADGRAVPDIEIIDPASGEVRLVPGTNLRARADVSATLLTDGRVLVAGSDASGRNSAQVWDPDTGVVVGRELALPAGIDAAKTTLLADGTVLIGGTPRKGAAIYDPAADRITSISAEDLAQRHSEASSARLDVAATIPARDSTGAPVDTRVAIRLTQPLAMDTVSGSTLTLVGPAGAVAGRFVIAGDGRLLFFNPAVELLPDAAYTVFVNDASATDGRRMPLASATFTTRSVGDSTGFQNSAVADGSASHASRFDLGTPPAVKRASDAQSKTPVPPTAKERKPAPPADDEEEIEDWSPGPEHRHGDWRISGRRGEPHARGVLSVPQPLEAAAGVTAVSGRVLRLNGRPIGGVTLRAGSASAVTDAQGRFLISGLTPGKHALFVDGATAQRGGRRYLSHYLQVEANEGVTRQLDPPIYLARKFNTKEISFPSPTPSEVVLTHPAIPGLELHIPKGSVLRAPDGKIVTTLGITPLPVNRVPFPVPMGFPVYFAISPAGVFVDNSGSEGVRGIRVIYPNYVNAPPGTRVVFWNYDPYGEGWQVYGHGSVTPDGKSVVPDAGVQQQTLMAFGWGLENHDNDPPDGPTPGDSVSCGDPVDCGTGLFLHRSLDFFVPDTIPISFMRTYRQNDPNARDFGVGINHTYGMFLSNPTANTSAPEVVDLILPDGGRVRFDRIQGTSTANVVFEHTATPSRYQGSRLRISTITHAWELTLKDKSVFVFEPHTPNRLIQYRDRLGNALSIERSGSHITRIVSPHGRFLSFTYDTADRVTQIVDNGGRIVGYEYDASGRLWKVTDPDGKVEEYGYDSANRMTTVTDRRGHVMVTNVFDTNGRVQQQTLADGAIWHYAYETDGERVIRSEVTDPRGYIRRNEFNLSGYLVKATFALGEPEERSYTYTREPVTNLITASTDFLGRVTKMGYDPLGNLSSLVRRYGTAGAVTYGFTYHPIFNALTSMVDPLNHETRLDYDAAGNLVTVTDALGHTFRAGYDSEGNLTRVTDGLGKVTELAYDLGDTASITDSMGRSIEMFTDSLGRMTGSADAAGHRSQFKYDPVGRLVQSTDPLGLTTAVTYDANGNVRTVTDARNLAAHEYTYDDRNRIRTYTDPLGATATMSYDGLSNVTSVIDRMNRTTSYEYDPFNRLKKVTYGDGSTLVVTEDDTARTATFADSLNGTITQTYDDLGRLVTESGPDGQIDFQYDTASRRTQMTVAGVPTPILYGYDDANRLTSISQGSATVSITYDDADRRLTTTLPNGVVATYSYNDADQLTAISFDKGATHVGDLAYSYDSAGRRASMSGSLAKALQASAMSSATYNAANRLTSWNGTALTYDAEGNMTGVGASTYTWNARGQLTASSEGSATFSYDALGRRRERTVSGVTTSYQHDGPNVLTTNGQLLLMGPGLDELYASVSSSGVTSHLTDSIGSTVALTDAAGTPTAGFSYSAYGESGKTGTADTSFRYTSRESDGASGLQYNRARYYHPRLGRFISEDPAGLMGGINVYAYALGDPVSFTDPTGLTACLDFVRQLVNLWSLSKGPVNLGQTMLGNRGTVLPAWDGFKPPLVQGGQNGSVSQHIYGHAGARMGIPYGPGRAASRVNAGIDYIQRWQKNRTVTESEAELADDAAAAEVAEALENAWEKRERREREASKHNSCPDLSSIEKDLNDALKNILCQ